MRIAKFRVGRLVLHCTLIGATSFSSAAPYTRITPIQNLPITIIGGATGGLGGGFGGGPIFRPLPVPQLPIVQDCNSTIPSPNCPTTWETSRPLPEPVRLRD